MFSPQYIPPPQLPEYPRYCAESAAALLRDLAGNLTPEALAQGGLNILSRLNVREAQAIRRALLDAEYLSQHIRRTLEGK